MRSSGSRTPACTGEREFAIGRAEPFSLDPRLSQAFLSGLQLGFSDRPFRSTSALVWRACSQRRSSSWGSSN